ncbi:MAG TPA: hypothetical protein VG097_16255 [Gemmata sp.]|nr:hypothetical protein [Gemmata sp.]
MPIRTTCPECLAVFNIPDRFAGKTVTCRECTGHIPVPGGEIDESEDGEELEERPRKKSYRNSEDDDYLPRKRRKAKSKGPSTGIVIGIVVGAVVLIGVAVAAVVLISSRKNQNDDTASRGTNNNVANTSKSNSGNPTIPDIIPLDPRRSGSDLTPSALKRPALPAGWVDFHHPKGLYSIYLPSSPILTHSSSPRNRPPQNLPFGGIALDESYVAASLNKDRPLTCGINICPSPPGGLQGFQGGQANSGAANLFPGVKWSNTYMNWAGKPAVEMTVELDIADAVSSFPGGNQFPKGMQPGGSSAIPAKSKSYIRYVVVNDKIYMFAINSLVGSPSEAERAAFYDSVVFGK